MLSLDIDQRVHIFSLGIYILNFDLYSGGRNFIVEGKRLICLLDLFLCIFILSKYRISVLNRFIHCLSRLAQKGRAVFKAPLHASL